MSSFFSICCGEGEEEKRFGSVVDPNDYDWGPNRRSSESEQEERSSQQGRIRYVEQLVGLLAGSKRKSAGHNKDSAERLHGGDNDEADNNNNGKFCDISDRKMLRVDIRSRPLDLTEDFRPPVFDKTEAETRFLERALDDNFVFMDLTPAEHRTFVLAMQRVAVVPGTVIIQQGDVGDYFYVVERGTVNFVDDSKGGVVVGRCADGGSFGELALLYDCPRAVSCVAAETAAAVESAESSSSAGSSPATTSSASPIVLWKVDQHTFRQILARSSHEKRSNVKAWLSGIDTFKGMSECNRARFAEALVTVHWKEGDRIVQKGEVGNVFYVLQEGRVKVHDIGGLGDSNTKDHEIGPGSFFGEGSLLTGEPRAASVTALTDVTTLALDRDTFEHCLGPLKGLLDFGLRKKYLQVLPLFSAGSLSEPEIDQLVPLMKEVCYRRGELLATPGKPYQMRLWIIRKGRVLVYSTKNPDKIHNLQAGDYFGDKSIRGDPHHVSRHTAICEENLTAWVLTRDDIESVIGDIDRLGATVDYARWSKPASSSAVQLRDLKKVRKLGAGAFGTVWLVAHKSERTPYALKSISKRRLIESHQVHSVKREKELQCLIENQFILGLIGAYQDEKYLYLLSPVVPGGELYDQLQTRKTRRGGLPERDAAFYAACVVEGLGHFHQRSIAYRDLKLENLMINAEGYVTIVDLGFAKIVPDMTFTLVGTPEYLAPEIIMAKGHDKSVDYWSYGVLVYELLVGYSPFYRRGTTQMEMFKRIVMMKYAFPECVNEDASSFISKLLVRRPSNRLGNLANGVLGVKGDKWFKSEGMDFKRIIKKEIEAPWKPEPKDLLSAAGPDDFAEEAYGARLTKAEQELFRDFSS